MKFSDSLLKLKSEVLKEVRPYFERIFDIEEKNTFKMLESFRDCKVSDSHFGITSGYAYDDIGRAKLDEVYAKIFRAERALVRANFVSGTHALATALFGILRPGDKLVSLTGAPYDTMQTVIGHAVKSKGSLKEFGVDYDELPLVDGKVDICGIKNILNSKTKMVLLQRSRGYSNRDTLTINELEKIISEIKKYSPNTIIFVDNCYGEFVEEREPIEVGADIVAGSLIKNPGGGLAPTGGYIAGRADLVELSSYRLTAPGMGDELGASLISNRLFFQGLFTAPHTVGEALKSAIFAAGLFEKLGYNVFPKKEETRGDIIQAIELGNPQKLEAFCRGIQKFSPVDSFATPEAWEMPGYEDKVIMAAGTFIQGASIELSADAPLREPYNVYLQGGLNFSAACIGIMGATNEII